MSQPARKVSKLALHEGQALRSVAATYPLLLEVILEAVQNALDANATRVWIVINQKSRKIAIRDNGYGVTPEKFEEALTSICSSIKETGKLGQFGRGLIAPLGKCVQFTFTSCARGQSTYMQWTFVSETLFAQREFEGVPMAVRTDIYYEKDGSAGCDRRGMSSVPWRTEVFIDQFTDDRMKNDVTAATLAENITDRYGAVMRERNATVRVKFVDEQGREQEQLVQAKAFTGRPLPEVIVTERDAGATTFRLFVARKDAKKGRRGKVLMGVVGNDFRFQFALFSRSTADMLEKEVADALNSGVFEGEIVSQKAELHPNRRSFEKNDALMGLCISLAQWFEQTGKQYLNEAENARQEVRYQELGLASLKVLEGMLSDPAYEALRKTLSQFERGTIGSGHADVSGRKTPQGETSMAVQGGAGHERGEGDGDERERPKKPKGPKEDHHPFTVVGPKGKQRATVRSDSLGLQFSHETMTDCPDLWVLDVANGVLRFNILHQLWVKCESSDRAIMRLQELIAVKALTWLTLPEVWQESARFAFDEVLRAEVFLILEGDRLAGRRPGKSIPRLQPPSK